MPDNDIRRNDPCPCGSGRRYKNCHGALQVRATDSPALIARAQFAAGAIAEAERSARAAVERDETDADAWTVLGMCIEASQPDAALAAFEKAVALADSDRPALRHHLHREPAR